MPERLVVQDRHVHLAIDLLDIDLAVRVRKLIARGQASVGGRIPIFAAFLPAPLAADRDSERAGRQVHQGTAGISREDFLLHLEGVGGLSVDIGTRLRSDRVHAEDVERHATGRTSRRVGAHDRAGRRVANRCEGIAEIDDIDVAVRRLPFLVVPVVERGVPVPLIVEQVAFEAGDDAIEVALGREVPGRKVREATSESDVP